MIASCALDLTSETLSAWRSRALPPEEWRQIDDHIRDCAACQTTLERFDRIARALRQPPQMPSGEAVWQGVQRRIVAHQHRGGIDQRKLLTVAGLGITGVLVVIFTVVLLVLPPSQATTSTQMHLTPVASVTNAPINPSATPIPPTPTLTQQEATIVINNLNNSPQFICGVSSLRQQKQWCDPQPGLALAAGPIVYVNSFAFASDIVAHDRLTYQVLWRYDGPAGINLTPVMVQGAFLYLWSVSNGHATITALDTTTGHVAWQSPSLAYSGDTGPQFMYDAGTIFVGIRQDNITYALDAVTGQVQWQQTMHGGKVVAVGDTVVFVCTFTSLSALDRTSGQMRWTMPLTNGASFAAAANDTLFVQGERGTGNAATFLDIDPSGKQLWATPVIAGDGSVLSIANGTIYLVGSNGVTVYAIAADTGQILWQHTTTAGCQFLATNNLAPLQGNVVMVNNGCISQTFGFRASDGTPLWHSPAQMDAALDGVGYGMEENPGSTTLKFDAVRLSDGVVLWQVSLP